MQPVKFEISKYATRPDLELSIRSVVGNDIEMNRDAGHTIEGTRAELEKFNLSDTSRIFGVQVVITEPSKKTRKIVEGKKRRGATR